MGPRERPRIPFRGFASRKVVTSVHFQLKYHNVSYKTLDIDNFTVKFGTVPVGICYFSTLFIQFFFREEALSSDLVMDLDPSGTVLDLRPNQIDKKSKKCIGIRNTWYKG